MSIGLPAFWWRPAGGDGLLGPGRPLLRSSRERAAPATVEAGGLGAGNVVRLAVQCVCTVRAVADEAETHFADARRRPGFYGLLGGAAPVCGSFAARTLPLDPDLLGGHQRACRAGFQRGAGFF